MSTNYLWLSLTTATLILTPAIKQAQPRNPARADVALAAQRWMAIDDPAIVGIFDAANTWDIDLGRLALRKSHDARVRRFADMMVRDHSAARKLGRDLAARLGVVPTTPDASFALYTDHRAVTAKLESESGASFDKDYIDHEVWYHQAVIDAVTNTLLPATKNTELKELELKIAPNFQAHLAAAKDLQQKLTRQADAP